MKSAETYFIINSIYTIIMLIGVIGFIIYKVIQEYRKMKWRQEQKRKREERKARMKFDDLVNSPTDEDYGEFNEDIQPLGLARIGGKLSHINELHVYPPGGEVEAYFPGIANVAKIEVYGSEIVIFRDNGTTINYFNTPYWFTTEVRKKEAAV